MKKSSLILLLFFFLGSCKEISFREPQPRGRRALKSVPQKLWGKYLTFQENGEISQDTIVITQSGYRFGYFDPRASSGLKEGYDVGVLSDSLVLKSYKHYYFLSFYENPEWLLRVIRQEKNGDLVYMAMEQEDVDFKDYARKLSAEITIDSIKLENETLYQIDPSPPKLIELIDKGLFSRTNLKKVR